MPEETLAEKKRRIEFMGFSLFLVGLCGLFLFFYMAFVLFTKPVIMGPLTTTDPSQVTSEFLAYLLRLSMPLIILLIVGGISLLVASKGITIYSEETKKNS